MQVKFGDSPCQISLRSIKLCCRRKPRKSQTD